MGFARLKAAMVAVIACALSANALIPNYTNAAEANADYGRRVGEIAKGIAVGLQNARQNQGIGSWIDPDNDTRRLREFAAGMYILSNPQRFSSSDLSMVSGLSSGSFQAHKDAFLAQLRSFSQTVVVHSPVGTDARIGYGDQRWVRVGPLNDGNFDMTLKEMIAVVYGFLDRPDVLPNDVLTQLITLNTTQSTIPYSGQESELSAVKLNKYGIYIAQRETENHTLMIYQWQFLINNVVRWIAGLDPSHPRYNLAIKKFYDTDPGRYTNNDVFGGWLVQTLTRIPRRGLFETNARAYESFTLTACMNLSGNASALFPNDAVCKKVSAAANNAVDYLAANYVFQSYHGKRNLSRRRNWDASYRTAVSLYSNDYVSNVFGVLDGAYDYDDRGAPANGACSNKMPYCNATGDAQPAGFAFLASLTGYKMPDILIDYALHPQAGWEAVSQTQYARDEYDHTSGVTAQSPLYPLYGIDQPTGVSLFGVKNRVLVTDNYASFSGGGASAYDGAYPVFSFLKQEEAGVYLPELKGYNTITTPIYLVGKGDVGWWPDLATARSEAMVGYNGNNFWNADNLPNTYKSLAVVPVEQLSIPDSWGAMEVLNSNFNIQTTGTAWFGKVQGALKTGQVWNVKLYQLANGDGLVVVRETMQETSRLIGFWDIIPGIAMRSWGTKAIIDCLKHSTATAEAIWNLGTRYKFAYSKIAGTATSFSNFVIGIDCQINADLDGPPMFTTITAPGNRSEFPLLEVSELDGFQNYTGRKIVANPDVGLININNFSTGATLTIDSRDRNNPTSSIPHQSKIYNWSAYIFNISPILNLLLN